MEYREVYQNLYNLTAGNYTISVTDAWVVPGAKFILIEPDTLIANV
jgi:hypothetical protein